MQKKVKIVVKVTFMASPKDNFNFLEFHKSNFNFPILLLRMKASLKVMLFGLKRGPDQLGCKLSLSDSVSDQIGR